MNRKLRVAILYGGKSGEHSVSLLSASSVIKAMDMDRYEIVPIGISTAGTWEVGEAALHMIASHLDNECLAQIKDQLSVVAFQDKGPFPLLRSGEIDIVFPVLHGTYGEDGTVQGLLEVLNLPYVGAGVLASAVGMDKIMMKKVLEAEGIPQGKYTFFLTKQFVQNRESVLNNIEDAFGYPCFIKPANLGSSVGISKASTRDELCGALKLAGKYDRKIIVEEFIDAREVEVAVLGNDDPEASIPGEIIPENEFYDFEAKYTEGKMSANIPANFSLEVLEKIRSLAIQSFKAVDGSGLARIDFFVRKSNGEILLNEINTMPGFTSLSMYPKMWAHSGLSYSELIDKLIQLGLERYEEKAQLVTIFEENT